MWGSKRKVQVDGLSPHIDLPTGSSKYIISNRVRLAGGLPPLESEIPSRLIADYTWLIGTHHRDFDDQEIYKTTKVYIMRVNKTPFIVADRVWLTNGRYSGKGDVVACGSRPIDLTYCRFFVP